MAESTTTLVDLLRHGECEGGPIFRGSLDVALSEAGLARMQAQADAQPGWQHVIASPLRRAAPYRWMNLLANSAPSARTLLPAAALTPTHGTNFCPF